MTTMLAALLIASAQPEIVPVSYRCVQIHDNFWTPRQKSLDQTTMDEQFRMLDEHGYKSNFELAAARKRGGYKGYVFNDSDVYKVLEAASYVLGRNPNPRLQGQVDSWIDLIGRVQQENGYLDTHFQVMEPENEWTNLRDQHELYCAGHLFEAASAHYEATGKKNFLNIAIELADHIYQRFITENHPGYPGHPEIELALFKLAKAAKNPKYSELAEHFLNSRGTKYFAAEHNTPLDKYDGAYYSDNFLIRDHSEIVGHAVRAAYLFSGAADMARENNDEKLEAMLDRVWHNTTEKRMFITGGLGPSGSNEGFTVDYDLPTFTAYQESCASIANALWNWRMGLLEGNSKYADVMETALYNGALAGISMKGDNYFYTNPLASTGNHHRQPWFDCACCPPNLARIIGQVGGLAYAASSSSIYVNLIIGGSANIQAEGQDVGLQVDTNYPWDGKVKFTLTHVGKKSNFFIKVRKPGWLTEPARFNGQKISVDIDGYFTIDSGHWNEGESFTLDFPMPARRVISHPSVKATQGMYALSRGPLIYCAEANDNAVDFDRIGLPHNSKIKYRSVSDGTLGKITELSIDGYESGEVNWNGQLFSPVAPTRTVNVRAIPYCMWDNRRPGAMRVWFSPNPSPAPLRGFEKDAQAKMSFVNWNCTPAGLNDGFVPESSGVNSPDQAHFWDHKGGEEWAELDLKSPRRITSSRVYWFDDTGTGECRVPAAWRLEAWVSGGWEPVELVPDQSYGLKLNGWNEIKFLPVLTDRMRLVITQQPGWASGIHEWQLF